MSASGVIGKLGFSEPMATRPRFHANDISRDVLNVVPRAVEIEDARQRQTRADAGRRGLLPRAAHQSAVRDFRDRAEIERVHVEEIRATAARGVRRRSRGRHQRGRAAFRRALEANPAR